MRLSMAVCVAAYSAQQLAHFLVTQSGEGPTTPPVLEQPDLELARGNHAVGTRERRHRVLQRGRQRFEFVLGGGESPLDRLGVTAEHREARFVRDRALVGN